jgi:cytochrome c2|tara:strand:- start:291 stop:1187 length:897 start_codon:yes stop_codon:yes gene_type:complete
MNLNINIIIKSFLAISFTFLIVIGLIRISNNLFYVESINPPSKDELFANIDFIDETYFSEKSKPNNEINITHTVLGRDKLEKKLERQLRFVNHFKSIITAKELDEKISEEETALNFLLSGKSHRILNTDELEDNILIAEKKLNLLKAIRLSYGDIGTSEIASITETTTVDVVVPEKPKLTFEELLAAASIDAGKKVSSKCTACHGFNSGGGNRIGPNLWAILGKAKAEAAGFNYSDALKGLGGVWSVEDMNLWLKSPKKYAPGNSMAFVGLRKDKDRANLIAYLNSMSDSPVSLTNLK